MKKATKPMKKFAVVIRISCGSLFHFGHYVDRAFIVEAPSIDGINVESVSRTTGESRPVKVLAVGEISGTATRVF